MDQAILVLQMRRSRLKAHSAAVAEAVALFSDLGASVPSGGPLSEKKGVFWLALPLPAVDIARSRFHRLGYTESACLLDPLPRMSRKSHRKGTKQDVVTYRGLEYRLTPVFQEDSIELQETTPDKRTFAYVGADGRVRRIRGYRGGGDLLNRRGLPVCDARLLVNLVFSAEEPVFLDPFAGIGGVTLEAQRNGYKVLSCDIDCALRFGLQEASTIHCVADAARLPIGCSTVSAIATEPPFHQEADRAVISTVEEMHRVLIEGGRTAILCSERQAEGIARTASASGFDRTLETAINRKNLDCVLFVFEKT